MNKKLPFKLPVIVRANGDWFVRYFFENPETPGKYKEFEFEMG